MYVPPGISRACAPHSCFHPLSTSLGVYLLQLKYACFHHRRFLPGFVAAFCLRRPPGKRAEILVDTPSRRLVAMSNVCERKLPAHDFRALSNQAGYSLAIMSRSTRWLHASSCTSAHAYHAHRNAGKKTCSPDAHKKKSNRPSRSCLLAQRLRQLLSSIRLTLLRFTFPRIAAAFTCAPCRTPSGRIVEPYATHRWMCAMC